MLRIAVFLFLFNEYNCYLVFPGMNGSFVNPLSSRRPINSGKPPEYFDWRDKHMVSPAKDQLNCAACWAFTTVANIESHRMIYLGEPDILSEQFLIDCDDANKGCGDASIIQTFANIVTKFGGVLRYNDYSPYANGRQKCSWNPSKYASAFDLLLPRPQSTPVPVLGFRRVYPDEQIMAEYVYKYGPLSAAINSESMGMYTGGIDEPLEQNCDPKKLDHAVLIVGFNVYVYESGEKLPYWIIKNSWGTGWGDNGFYYLVRGRNACGIATDVSFAYVN